MVTKIEAMKKIKDKNIPIPIPKEFRSAKKIIGPHRFCVVGDGRIFFGLKGIDQKIHYFAGDQEIVGKIALECANLSAHAQKVMRGEKNFAPILHFETSHALTIMGIGSELTGIIEFRFTTPTGAIYATQLNPELSSQLLSHIENNLSRMADPPPKYKFPILESKVPGQSKQSGKTSVHFGQEYSKEILEFIGLMIIRANLLEKAQINLFSALLDVEEIVAEAMFYSSNNTKARLDLIRSVLLTSKLPEKQKKDISNCLEKCQAIADRRNLLVHGQWEFKKDKFIVKETKPLNKKPKQEPIHTLKSIKLLVQDYHDTSVKMELLTKGIPATRAIAKKTS